ncbi:hypothetical protein T492DRAFT_917157 [Pavlovales sp. CCMP2436]|nr:hypothetical protein T492DRAFT_917157 [Pavlovales sp. CCMP2436]
MVFTFLQMHFNRLSGGLVSPPRSYGSAPQGGWNVLLIHAHPLKGSFSSYLAHAMVNLYEFDGGKPLNPVLTIAERERYFLGTPPSPYPAPSSDIAPLVQSLRSADALVFVYVP